MTIQTESASAIVNAPAPTPVSYDEFLNSVDEDAFAEWIDGEVLMMTPASRRHQDIHGFVSPLLRFFVERTKCGKVLAAPFQMKLSQVRRGREPDIIFLSTENLHRLKETYLDGPADLVIEITSPESELRDRGEKYAEYEAEGVREYWVVDPQGERADFFVLDDEGRFERCKPDDGGVYHSHVLLGFKLVVDWLWQDPLPKLADALQVVLE